MGIVQKNSFWSTVIGYLGVAAGFVSAVVLLPRLLSPEELGLVNVLRAAAVILMQFSALGGANIVLRFFPFFRTPDGRYNGIFTMTMLISLAGTLIFSILYIIFKPEIVEYSGERSLLFADYCMFVLPISAGMVFYTLFAAWLRSIMKVIAAAVYIELVLKLANIAAVLLYAWGAVSFDAFLWLFALSFCLPAIGLLVHCGMRGMLTLEVRITDQMRKYFRPALRYGVFCLFAGFGTSMVGSVDSMMLSGMKGLESVAIYTIAVYFMSALQIPYRSMTAAASPLVAQYWQQNLMRRLLDLNRRFTLNVTIVTLGLFLLVWVNIDIIYSIMPPLYSAGKWAIPILFAGKFFDIASGLKGTIISMSKKYRWDLYSSLVLIALTLATNAALIPLWGIYGAALAGTISLTAVNLMRLWVVMRFYKMQPFTYGTLYAILLAFAAWAITALVPATGHWTADMAIRCAMVAALFGAPVYLLRLSDDFNSMVNNSINIILRRGKG